MSRIGRSFSLSLLLAISLVALMIPAPAKAIDLKSVYVLDFMRVVAEAEASKEAKNTIEKQVADKKSKLEARHNKLQSMKSDLQRQAAVLSQSVLGEKAKSIKESEADLMEDMRDFEDSVKSQNARVLDQLADKTREIVKEMASEDNTIDFVLLKQSRAVVYSTDRIDITDKVIDYLRKDGFKVKLN